MTLGFRLHIDNIPTFFVEKINMGLLKNKIISYPQFVEYLQKYYTTTTLQPKEKVTPKFHTIRKDEKNIWKSGNLIHFVIGNRTKKRFQFAPVINCVSTQEIKIKYWYNSKTQMFDLPDVIIDGNILSQKTIEKLAINDGFENVANFFAYFNTNFEGKIIHWTDLKY